VNFLQRHDTRRARQVVALVALAFLGGKLFIAANTYGTEDIRTWLGFAHGVAERGPVGVYGIDFTALNGTLYNHPPLIGYFLMLTNGLAELGLPLKVTLRAVSSAADVASALLVFEILRTRGSLGRATASAFAVAASPVLVLISGYHGNTDPIFLMLVLLGSFLLIDKQRAIAGGSVLALALGIKLVPIVVLPVVAAYLVRHRRDLLPRATGAFFLTFAVVWGPALFSDFHSVREHVLGYGGIPDRPWGLVNLANSFGRTGTASFLVDPGKYLVLMIASLIPAAMVWRKPTTAMPAVGLSLVIFLSLSPAFAVQYLAWAVAASYLLDFWLATVYNLLGGLVLYEIYDRWNGGLPWTEVAPGQVMTPSELTLLALLWAALLSVLARGSRAFRTGQAPPTSPEQPEFGGQVVSSGIPD
jgi:hypothetical protein